MLSRGVLAGGGDRRADVIQRLLRARYEQALVCLSNRELVDASRGCTFHCKMANNRFFL